MKKMKKTKRMKKMLFSFPALFSFSPFSSLPLLFRRRKGHGVHSPFMYNLITKVIEEKSAFYAFEEIENFRRKILAENNTWSKITAQEVQSPNYGKFLFRMVHFFKCRNVIQIGGSTGIMSLYLALASGTQDKCYILEERPCLLSAIDDFILAHHLKQLHLMEGACEENLKTLHILLQRADFIFIHSLPESMGWEKLYTLCEPLMRKTSIVVLHNIRKNQEMKKGWRFLQNLPQARVTIDLYVAGMVFFDDKLPKRHYKAYFNHGKKQNLYANRRRGLYFIGRRKKSSKNQSSN
jgi:predicted O-methyltransferase YrrM